jgi:PAS domain S-box-containing protein
MATNFENTSPFPAGGGGSGAAFRAFSWSSSPLGLIAAWPPELRSAAGLVLGSAQPVFACWGESLILLHNDGCLDFGGGRFMLGKTLACGWPGIAALLTPVFKRLLASGQGEVLAEQRVLLDRPRQRQEIFLTFACSPLRLENGGIGGVLVSCSETTETVLARRRLQAGQDLADRLRHALTPADICRQAREAFTGNRADIPFALVYRFDEERRQLRLAAVAGLTAAAAAPELIDGGSGEQPLFLILTRGSPELVAADTLGISQDGASPLVHAFPLLSLDRRALGALVLGINPHQPFNAAYREFQQLLATQLAAALCNAHLQRQHLQLPYFQVANCDPQTAEVCQLLCESEGRLRAIVDYAPAAIYVKDLCFNYMMGNEQFAKITGTSRRQLQGKDDYALFPAVAADRFRADDRKVLASGTYLETEEEVRLADGLHTYFTVKFPLMDDRRNIYAIAGISTDITEIKSAEAELRQSAAELSRSNEELEQFAYIISHDLREPLRTIGGFLNLLQRRHGRQLDPHARELITFTMEGAARLDRMITDLLEYSRIQQQKQALRRVDLFSVWLTAVDNLYVVIEESGAHISHDELPVITGDESQLVRLWQNLMSNAIKFRGDRRPEIHVGVREQQDQWLFSVRDNGIGIQPEFADRIFQVFQRLHTQREYPGSGIGLAVCKKIVERHGGRIWMKSHPGRGTTFYFTIAKKPR